MNTTVLNIIESANHDFRYPMELDLANSEHAAYLAGCFGGEEHFKSNYPDMYTLYKNGIARAVQMRENNESVEAPKKGFVDAAVIADVLYLQSRKCAYAVGDMNLTQQAKRLLLSMDIYKEDVNIAHNAEYFNNEYYGDISCRSQTFEIPEGEVQKYKAVLTAAWQPKDSNYMRAMLAFDSSTTSYGTSDEVVDSMTVNDPVHKKTSETGPIKVSYARSTSNLDYVYPESRESSTNLEKVFLDISGSVTLKNGHKFSRLDRFDASLQCKKSGTIFYNRVPDETQIYASEDRTSFTWKLNNDWNNTIPESVQFGNRTHDFDMQIRFYCDGDDAVHRIVVSSSDYPELEGMNSYKKISQIQLFWGCVAEDTSILMADGSTKKAKEIVKGDIISDKDGKPRVISDVIEGTSIVIYHLKLVSGQELLATNTHPICTDAGCVTLESLNTSTNVLTADSGKYSKVMYCYPENYGGKVYSFDLEDGDTLCTNGIVTGSHEAQGKLAEMASDVDGSEADADVLEEIRQLKSDRADGLFLNGK